MRQLLFVIPLLLLNACGNDTSEAATRDSAGVTIVELAAGAWEAAPVWSVDSIPLASIGGESDSTLDLSQLGSFAVLVADNGLMVSTPQPAALLAFDSAGERIGQFGRQGEGPGEYRAISSIAALGGDTVMAYEIVARKGILYNRAGDFLSSIEMPLTGMAFPYQLMGRTSDGTFVFILQSPFAEAPPGSEAIFRPDMPVVVWRSGNESYDTLFTLPGVQSTKSKIEIAPGQAMDIARAVAFGAVTFVAVHGDQVWSTTGESFEFEARDVTGALKRIVRMPREPREVTTADQDRYKGILREVWEAIRARGAPAPMVESELAKIDATEFAPRYPAIGQLLVARTGEVWISTGVPMIDDTMEWGVFNSEGKLLGRVTLPEGMLYSASDDRVVLRQEDPETDLVSILVLKLNHSCAECE
jgi:hypothetical protein